MRIRSTFHPVFNNLPTAWPKALVDRHELQNKTLIEISCGKGDFLKLLCQLGANTGYGFDPSYVGELTATFDASSVHFVQDFMERSMATILSTSSVVVTHWNILSSPLPFCR